MGRTWKPLRPLSRVERIRQALDPLARACTGPADVVALIQARDVEDPDMREEVIAFVSRRMRIPLDQGQRAWVLEQLAKADARKQDEREFTCAGRHSWRGQRSEPQTCPECGAEGLLVLDGDNDPAAFDEQSGAQP